MERNIHGVKMWNGLLKLKQLTEALSSSPCMAYFTKSKDTYVTVDASPVGISAILSQKSKGHEDEKIIAYASCALTEVKTH